MLRGTVGRLALRKPKSKLPSQVGPHDIPLTVGGLVMQKLRPFLPYSWQTGARWRVVQSSWMGLCVLFFGWWTYALYFKNTEEQQLQRARQYEYIRDERGRVIDLAYAPLAQAAKRARARTQRLLHDEDE